MSEAHRGISCNSCGVMPMLGRRYKCLICYDFDLCEACHDASEFASNEHTAEHAMQVIRVPSAAAGLSDAPEELAMVYLAKNPLTCPYCGNDDLTESDLIKHVNDRHYGEPTQVVCPVCVVAQVNPNYVSVNFPEHLKLRHGPGASIKRLNRKIRARVVSNDGSFIVPSGSEDLDAVLDRIGLSSGRLDAAILNWTAGPDTKRGLSIIKAKRAAALEAGKTASTPGQAGKTGQGSKAGAGASGAGKTAGAGSERGGTIAEVRVAEQAERPLSVEEKRALHQSRRDRAMFVHQLLLSSLSSSATPSS